MAKRVTKTVKAARAMVAKGELGRYLLGSVGYVTLAARMPPLTPQSVQRVLGRAGIETGVLTLSRRDGGKLVFARAA